MVPTPKEVGLFALSEDNIERGGCELLGVLDALRQSQPSTAYQSVEEENEDDEQEEKKRKMREGRGFLEKGNMGRRYG